MPDPCGGAQRQHRFRRQESRPEIARHGPRFRDASQSTGNPLAGQSLCNGARRDIVVPGPMHEHQLPGSHSMQTHAVRHRRVIPTARSVLRRKIAIPRRWRIGDRRRTPEDPSPFTWAAAPGTLCRRMRGEPATRRRRRELILAVKERADFVQGVLLARLRIDVAGMRNRTGGVRKWWGEPVWQPAARCPLAETAAGTADRCAHLPRFDHQGQTKRTGWRTVVGTASP